MSQINSLNSFIGDYQKQQDKANAANEKRYKQLLSTARQGGVGERNLIRRDFADNWGNIQQDAIGRGLFNTSFLDSQRNRNMESRGVALNQSLQNQRNTVMGIMERRTDQGPNLGLLSSYLQAAAQGMGQNAGQTGNRSFNFGGINMPTQPLDANSIFGRGGAGGGAGGGGGNAPVDFGGVGGGGGGNAPGVTTTRNTGIGFNPGRGDYVSGGSQPALILDPISGTMRRPGAWQTYGRR